MIKFNDRVRYAGAQRKSAVNNRWLRPGCLGKVLAARDGRLLVRFEGHQCPFDIKAAEAEKEPS